MFHKKNEQDNSWLGAILVGTLAVVATGVAGYFTGNQKLEENKKRIEAIKLEENKKIEASKTQAESIQKQFTVCRK